MTCWQRNGPGGLQPRLARVAAVVVRADTPAVTQHLQVHSQVHTLYYDKLSTLEPTVCGERAPASSTVPTRSIPPIMGGFMPGYLKVAHTLDHNLQLCCTVTHLPVATRASL